MLLRKREPLGDEIIKALAVALTEENKLKGLETFEFSWEGTRVPEKVIFPTGVEREVGYMRDGIMNFRSVNIPSVTYERLSDIYPKQPQSIIIAYVPSEHQLPDKK